MGTISKNFSYNEFEASSVAKEKRIDNTIKDWRVRDAIKSLVDNLLQPLRDHLDARVNVSSGYRCPELNKEVGGSPTSQHPKGEAADVWSPVYTPYQIACAVIELGLAFDQLILYPGFVHLSYKLEGRQRKQILYNKSYRGKKLESK